MSSSLSPTGIHPPEKRDALPKPITLILPHPIRSPHHTHACRQHFLPLSILRGSRLRLLLVVLYRCRFFRRCASMTKSLRLRLLLHRLPPLLSSSFSSHSPRQSPRSSVSCTPPRTEKTRQRKCAMMLMTRSTGCSLCSNAPPLLLFFHLETRKGVTSGSPSPSSVY